MRDEVAFLLSPVPAPPLFAVLGLSRSHVPPIDWTVLIPLDRLKVMKHGFIQKIEEVIEEEMVSAKALTIASGP